MVTYRQMLHNNPTKSTSRHFYGICKRRRYFVPRDPMDHLVTTSKHCSGKLAVNWGKRANAVISINYTHNKDGKAGEEVLLKDSPLTRTHLRTDSNTLVLDNF